MLANLVLTDNQLYNHNLYFKEFYLYDYGQIIKYPKLPTLYVGYKESKEIVKINPLSNKISYNKYWIPSIIENKNEFIKGLSKFKFSIYEYYKTKINYTYINLFNKLQLPLLDLVKNFKAYNYDNKSLFFYTNRTVYSLDVRQLKLFNITLDDFEIITYKNDYYLNLFEGDYRYLIFIYNLTKHEIDTI